MLIAALDGIDQDMDAPEPLNEINVYHLTRDEREEQKKRLQPVFRLIVPWKYPYPWRPWSEEDF